MVLDTAQDRYHLERIERRLGDQSVKLAFSSILETLRRQNRFELETSPNGAYSVLNLRYNDRRCYALRGTRGWIAWYFRKPAFEEEIVTRQSVLSTFVDSEPFKNDSAEEIWIKVRTPREATRVLDFIL